MLKRDYDRAIADFEAAIKINPKYENAILNRSRAAAANTKR